MEDGIRVSGAPPPPALLDKLSNRARVAPQAGPADPPVKMAPRPPPEVLQRMRNEAVDTGGEDEIDDEFMDSEGDDDLDDLEDEDEEEEEEEEETPEQAARRKLLEEEQKAAMLARIAKIKTVHRLTGPSMTRFNSVDDVRFELRRLEDELVLRQSVKVQRRMLMAVASGIEFLHHKTAARGRLSGWSESIMAGIDDYDDVFDRLHRKHAPKLGFGKGRRTEPEVELAMMVGYSAFSYALSSSMTDLGKPTPSQQAKGAPPGGFSADRYKQRAAEMDFKSEEAALTSFASKPKPGPEGGGASSTISAGTSSSAAASVAAALGAPKAVTFSSAPKR